MKPLITHFSHPHSLKLFESKADEEENQFICSGCNEYLSTDPAYTCPKLDCEFFLHKSCFELPRKLKHKSHPDNLLTLLSEPPESSIYYDCNACGSLIKGFSFHCQKTDYRLDTKCAFLPETVECKAHEHVLAVRYANPKNTDDDSDKVNCKVCDYYVMEGYWSYDCKDCDFCTHLDCASSAEVPKEEEEDNEEDEDEDEEELSDQERLMRANIKAMNQMAILQFQMQMSRLNAQSMANMMRW